MKKIGLVGGMGPESTIEYYEGIIEAFKKLNKGKLDYPDIVIYSLNLSTFLEMMRASDLESAVDYLAGKLKKLEAAGADIIALTANTPHVFFDELNDQIDVPLVSIVEATAREAQRLGLERPGLLGTEFTMNRSFFKDVFQESGREIVVPNKAAKEYVNEKLFSEIELGIFNDSTRNELTQIIYDMKQNSDIDGIIMGCTELPLILPDNYYHDLPVLNTTQIHIDEIVNLCRE